MSTPASNLQLAARKSIGLSGIIAAVFGFLSDVLQPIAPFAFYIFVVTGIIAATSLFIVLKSKASRAATLFIFSSMAAAFTGINYRKRRQRNQIRRQRNQKHRRQHFNQHRKHHCWPK